MVDVFCDVAEFLDKLFLVVFGAGVQVDDGLLDASKLLLEVEGHHGTELPNLVLVLHLAHELFEVHSQQFEQIFFILFVLSQTKLKGVFSVLHICKKGEGVDPFEFLTAFYGKLVGSLHEFRVRQFHPQNLKEIFSFCEDIDLFIVVCHGLIEDKSLGTVVHSLHHFLLPVYCLIRSLLVNVTFEVVFVVRLPRL